MSQIGWPHLFPLAMGLRFGQELSAAGLPLDVLAEDGGASGVVRAVVQVPAAGPFGVAPVVVDPASAPLDDFFRVKSEAIVQPFTVGLLTSTCEQVIEIVRRAASPVCATCPALRVGDGACEWTSSSQASDLQVVSRGGNCLQPLRELFEYCRDLAFTAYASAGGVKPLQTIVLTTGSRHERNTELNLAFTANTAESDSAHQRVVHVSFHELSFSLNDYLALPYVLFHECFVHGYGGIPLDRGRPAEANVFQEGWMDAAAAMVLRAALQECSTSVPVALRNSASQALFRMREVVGVRYDRTRQNAPRDVTQWRIGLAAFDAFREVCRQALLPRFGQGAADHSELLAIKFSMELNASVAHDARVRRAFARAIFGKLHRTGAGAQTSFISNQSALSDAVEMYHSHGTGLNDVMERAVAIL